METTFRKSMALLHTWAGVLVGAVLFVVFWTGTLILFASEIDQWMMPDARLPAATAPMSLDRAAQLVRPLVPAAATQWRIDLPTTRMPAAAVSWRVPGAEEQSRLFDPVRYALLPEQGTAGASGFFVPLHYSLHLPWADVGKWLVGVAGMAMLALLVSGVVIHKKIFAQYFTFRSRKRLQRSALDLHNLTGVVLLPFHAALALSGLIIFMTIYFPQAYVATYGDGPKAKAAFMADAYGKYTRKRADAPAGAAGATASIDAMRAEATRLWGDGSQPYFVRVFHSGAAASYVELRRSYAREVAMNLDQLYFDAATGKPLRRFEARPVMTAQRVFSGIHFARFDHGLLRALYLVGGVGGCILIATGFLFWLGARRARHARDGLHGVRVVEAIAIASMTGLILATFAYLVSNRVLPADSARPALEQSVFYGVWLAGCAHAWLRGTAAWREQLAAIAVLAVAAVLANWVTTGGHLLHTVGSGLHAVAGVDAALLVCAALAWRAARHTARHNAAAAGLVRYRTLQ